jgi:hypothetical protein
MNVADKVAVRKIASAVCEKAVEPSVPAKTRIFFKK